MGVLEDLPNDVLRHILCFLPTKSMAADTRFVSTRWRELWNDGRAQHKHGSIIVTVTTNLGFGDRVECHHWIKPCQGYRWRLQFYHSKSGFFFVPIVDASHATKGELRLDFSNGTFPDNVSVWWTCLRLMGLCFLDLPYLGTRPTICAPKVSSEEDRISSLPDKVLQQIIYLLPIKSVAKTSIVSTRWYYLQYKGLSKYVHDPAIRLIQKSDRNFLSLVTTRRPHIGHDSSYVWSTVLESMVSYIPCDPPTRSIHLTWVHPLSHGLVSLLLSNPRFRDLETLQIIRSRALSKLNLFGLDKLSLLSIDIIVCDDHKLLNVIRYNKGTTTMCYRGRCHFTRVSAFRGASNVMLDFREGPMARDVPLKYQLLFILRSLRAAKRIIMCRWMFEDMIRNRFSSSAEFSNMRELSWIDNAMEEENIDSLIAFLEWLPMLEILIVKIDPTCYRLSRKVDEGESGECNHGSLMLSPRNERRLRHLKIVIMINFEHEEDEMRLARHLFHFGGSRPSKSTGIVPTVPVPTVRLYAESRKFYPRRLMEILPNLCRRFVR